MKFLTDSFLPFYLQISKEPVTKQSNPSFRMLRDKSLLLPNGLRFCKPDKHTKKYYKELKKKFKNKGPDSSIWNEIMSLEENKILAPKLRPENYYQEWQNPLPTKLSMRPRATVLEQLEAYEDWLYIDENDGIVLEGQLKIDFPNSTVGLAKLKKNKIKELELFVQDFMYNAIEFRDAPNGQILKNIRIWTAQGFQAKIEFDRNGEVYEGYLKDSNGKRVRNLTSGFFQYSMKENRFGIFCNFEYFFVGEIKVQKKYGEPENPILSYSLIKSEFHSEEFGSEPDFSSYFNLSKIETQTQKKTSINQKINGESLNIKPDMMKKKQRPQANTVPLRFQEEKFSPLKIPKSKTDLSQINSRKNSSMSQNSYLKESFISQMEPSESKKFFKNYRRLKRQKKWYCGVKFYFSPVAIEHTIENFEIGQVCIQKMTFGGTKITLHTERYDMVTGALVTSETVYINGLKLVVDHGVTNKEQNIGISGEIIEEDEESYNTGSNFGTVGGKGSFSMNDIYGGSISNNLASKFSNGGNIEKIGKFGDLVKISRLQESEKEDQEKSQNEEFKSEIIQQSLNENSLLSRDKDPSTATTNKSESQDMITQPIPIKLQINPLSKLRLDLAQSRAKEKLYHSTSKRHSVTSESLPRHRLFHSKIETHSKFSHSMRPHSVKLSQFQNQSRKFKFLRPSSANIKRTELHFPGEPYYIQSDRLQSKPMRLMAMQGELLSRNPLEQYLNVRVGFNQVCDMVPYINLRHKKANPKTFGYDSSLISSKSSQSSRKLNHKLAESKVESPERSSDMTNSTIQYVMTNQVLSKKLFQPTFFLSFFRILSKKKKLFLESSRLLLTLDRQYRKSLARACGLNFGKIDFQKSSSGEQSVVSVKTEDSKEDLLFQNFLQREDQVDVGFLVQYLESIASENVRLKSENEKLKLALRSKFDS